MYQLIETIRIENGKIPFLKYHIARLHQARKQLFQRYDAILHIEKRIKSAFEAAILLQNELQTVPVVRCRLLYNTDITKIEFFPYHIRPIQSIELVENNEIDYALKFANRVSLDILKKDIDADEIIIVKNQLLTDTTYTNIALYDGKRWQTPAFPLLKGTKRTYLLEKKIIFEQDILANNIKAYSNIRFFNGMINWEEAPSYPIQLLLQKRTK